MILKKITAIAALCAISFCLSAQQKPGDYAGAWKTIDSLINKKGLTQSALAQVDKLYARAKNEHNDAQLIKTLLYRMNLQETREEDATAKNTAALEKEIDTAQEPARSILRSILAEIYWNYFQANRYKLYNRTAATNYKKEDLATWDRAEFHKRIGELYLSSLKDERLLQRTGLAPFEAIISKGNTRNLRPTLFDLLAHRALEYFTTNEQDLDRPAYAFEIDDSTAFADKSVFTDHSFINQDSASLHFRALGLFQQLIHLHLKDADPSALLDVDLERIAFVNQYTVLEDKETLYASALTHITDLYPNEPIAAQSWYLQAKLLADKATHYDPNGDTANRYAYLPAETICQKVLQQKDSSEGKSNCHALLRTILRKELSLQTEKVNLPGKPFRTLASWRNFSQLYFRVIPIDRAGRESLGNNPYTDGYWEKLLAFSPIKEFSQSLPATEDHQQHRVEIKTDALLVGEYALIASATHDFSLSSPPMAVQFFYVSEIAYIRQGNDFFVLDRSSGQPLANATVQVWNQVYDYQSGKHTLKKSGSYQSDDHGYLLLKEKTNARQTGQLLEIHTNTDHLFMDEAANVYPVSTDEDGQSPAIPVDKQKYENNHKQTFFFTDRSIYRPGQTLYFKGIVVTRDFVTRQSKIMIGLDTKLFLYNANGEKIDSILTRTNDFGSYQGRFRLPEGQLNGEFRLEDDSASGSTSFSVEEYKRPKFEVKYDPLKGSYRVCDTLKIHGKAIAYAGNAIDGANITYRVVRETRVPYSWLSSRWRTPPGNSQEITHGTLKTGADGTFTISFPAIPDRTVNKELDPVFDYKVVADITDINGETRSGETTVSVGYKALMLSVQLPSAREADGAYPSDSLKKINVSTTNTSGIFEAAPLHITVFQLKAPDRLIRERYWEQPDQFVMSREEYFGYFPHDEYREETKQSTWERTQKVYETNDNSRENGSLPLKNISLKAGWYAFEVIAKDKYGQEVKDIQYIELYGGNRYSPTNPRYDWIVGGVETTWPGSRISMTIGSSATNVYVIRQVEKRSPNENQSQEGRPAQGNSRSRNMYDFFSLSKDKKEFSFDIGETDRGGFGIRHAFVKDNRFYSGLYTIQVPWSNKELSIGYSSYRDKTLPGSGEKWQLTIRGNKGEKVAAEVLAGMYDASLDQFKPQGWAKPDLWYGYEPRSPWNNGNGFSKTESLQKNFNEHSNDYFDKRYDALLQPETNQMAYASGRILSFRSVPMPMASSATQALELKTDKVTYKDISISSGDMFIHGEKMAADSTVMNMRSGKNQTPEASPPSTQSPIQIRKNFNETAFFFPDLRTDSASNISFSFTMPEALTSWKWMSLAHTRDLSFGYSEKTIVTQKQLMVQPNAPRFLREGDRLELSAKIVNLSDSEMTGQVVLELIDATTNQSVDGWFSNRQANQYFTVAAGQSAAIRFPIEIPYQFNRPVTYRIVARAKYYSDGEEDMLPVVSNRVLVTESLPLNIRGNGTRNFSFGKLLQSGSSETLNNHALTVEFSSNPAWYAVQALPYLIDYPYECAEQTFERYYANALASSIVKNAPRIRDIFSTWKTKDTVALLSNLEKNPELKSVLLEETPWVLEAQSESQQKRNIALLFDMTRMTKDLGAALNKLQELQSSDGGFPWFKGGPGDRYITQTILSGIGHLRKLQALPTEDDEKINAIMKSGLDYLDKMLIADYDKIKADYERIKTQHSKDTHAKGTRPITDELDNLQIQYLYLRSLFADYDVPGPVFPAMNFYRKQAQQYWLQQNRYMQGMIALALFRTGDIQTAKDIMKSLKQNALNSEELGTYWKDMQGGYYWHQAPIETQSLLIEAFREITHDTAIDQGLKIWLLKQKQTQSWPTTKATADACYALLLGGSHWLVTERRVEIRLGDKTVVSDRASAEAGTGYFKKVFPGELVKPAMGNVSLTVSSPAGITGNPATASNPTTPGNNTKTGNSTNEIAWGAVYWQYFENADKVTPAGGTDPAQAPIPLKLTKKLFVTRNTDHGPVLDPLADNAELRVGDKVTVRIELRADREMEYVHMKDMRASCMEPVNVLSEYKWQDGLGYYETTKDASTNFFFDRIPRGVYVFEYSLFVSQAGNFSNGITTIQCMYAPEFSSYSEGTRVSVVAEP